MENLPPDPLLKQGAFIDLDNSNFPDPTPMPAEPSTPVHYSSGAGATSDATPRTNPLNPDSEAPDWLPPGWQVEFRVRTSGATAGHKDKYYYCPDSNRRFRSKKEVMSFLETGKVGSKKKKGDGLDGENTQSNTKRKKAVASRASVDNFKFNDVPAKVKWVLTDAYEGLWSPLVNGVDRVSELEKQDWAAAYRYLSLQKSLNGTTGAHP
ncbi:hypothetical protein V2J09_013955 [Rumex salicifolius]